MKQSICKHLQIRRQVIACIFIMQKNRISICVFFGSSVSADSGYDQSLDGPLDGPLGLEEEVPARSYQPPSLDDQPPSLGDQLPSLDDQHPSLEEQNILGILS